jgi:hypothetical protein
MSNFPINIEEHMADLSKRGKAKVEAEAAYDFLCDYSKTLIAKLASDMNDGSEASRERFARAHPDYLEHLKEKQEAAKLAGIARINYEVKRVFLEMKRSEASYTKAEMNLI